MLINLKNIILKESKIIGIRESSIYPGIQYIQCKFVLADDWDIEWTRYHNKQCLSVPDFFF